MVPVRLGPSTVASGAASLYDDGYIERGGDRASYVVFFGLVIALVTARGICCRRSICRCTLSYMRPLASVRGLKTLTRALELDTQVWHKTSTIRMSSSKALSGPKLQCKKPL